MSKYKWEDLSIGKVTEINNILGFRKESDINKLIGILCVINDKQPEYYREEIAMDELSRELQELGAMLTSEIDVSFDQFGEWKLLGRTFRLTFPVSKMTSGQFIDFEHFLSAEPNNLAMLLAVLLYPKGGKYLSFKNGDSYDLKDLAEEINTSFPFCKARGIANFFWQASIASRIVSLRYSRKKLLRQMKKEKDMARKEVLERAARETARTIQRLQNDAKRLI